MKQLFFLFATLCMLFTGCVRKTETPAPVYTGYADFRRFVVVGDGFTAGYMNGALYRSGQNYAVPNLLVQQARLAVRDSIVFLQPDTESEVGFGGLDEKGQPLGKQELKKFEPLDIYLPVRKRGDFLAQYKGARKALGNFSVPEAKVTHLLMPSFAAENHFFGRFAGTSATTLLSDAKHAGASFFLFALGASDFLNYALHGAIHNNGGNQTNDLTDLANFRAAYRIALRSLLADGASGLLFNFPDIAHMPFFNVLPQKIVHTTVQDSAALWKHYFNYNLAVVGWNESLRHKGLSEAEIDKKRRYVIVFEADKRSAPVIQDSTLSDATALMPNGTIYKIPKIRPLRRKEMLLLSFPREDMKNGLGTYKAVPQKYVLTLGQIERIRQRTKDFNAVLDEIMKEHKGKLKLVDVRTHFKELFEQKRNSINGVKINPNMSPGLGFFSADGIYFNARGAAYFTNRIIQTINLHYQANIPFLDLSRYPAN